MPECCGCETLKALSVMSFAASLLLVGVMAAVMWHTVSRSLVLFVGALIVFMEFLLFMFYCYSMVWMRRHKIKWHARRVWLPFFDLFWLTVALAVSINLLEWSSDDSLLEQVGLLDDAQKLSLGFVLLALAVKFIAAHLLTLVHVRILSGFAKTLRADPDANNYPFTVNHTAPFAPPADDAAAAPLTYTPHQHHY